MGTFRHTPDNIIYINTTSMPLAFFVTLEPAYSLAAPYTSRYYEQGVKHVLSDGTTGYGLSLPYTDGDNYILNEAAYAAAYAASLIPTLTLSQAKLARIQQMLDYSQAKTDGHVIVTIGGTPQEFFSTVQDLAYLSNEDLTYTRAGALPGAYYVNDVNYAQIAIAALADLEAVIDRIVGLHYLVRLNQDVHRAGINACGTIGAVNAYNYTTGWPVIPY